MYAFKAYFRLVEEVEDLAKKVKNMNNKELDKIIEQKDFSKGKLSHRFRQIGESPDLYCLLNLDDPIMLKSEIDKNKIWVFAYLIEKNNIGVFPYMGVR